jgi:hypothetical protein
MKVRSTAQAVVHLRDRMFWPAQFQRSFVCENCHVYRANFTVPALALLQCGRSHLRHHGVHVDRRDH